jgi:hypothetical protein
MNDVIRRDFGTLTDAQKTHVLALKTKGEEMWDLIDAGGPSREAAIAKTKTEEAVMWAVKGATAQQ